MADSNKENPEKGQFYWKSLKEFHDDPASAEAKANEFMAGVTDDFKLSGMSDMSRRKFLALLTASASFAAASCSTYPSKGEVIPYNKEPRGVIPGIANYYASTCTGCNQACGILVKTREGRPIKINGNDEHPVNKGKICARGQASILNLYDPERIREPQKKSGSSFSKSSWASANGTIISALSAAVSSGKEIAVVMKTLLSPTAKKAFDEFAAKYPTVKLYSYEFFSNVNRNSAWKKSYGSEQFPLISWDKAKLILALEADFLGNEGNMIEQTRMFVETRNNGDIKNFSRLVVAESEVSITGMNADIRLSLHPEEQYNFVMSLLHEFVVKRQVSRFALDRNVVNTLQDFSLEKFAERNGIDQKSLKGLVSYMSKYKDSSIVYAGDRLPESVHIAVNFLNEVLGSTRLYRENQANIELLAYSTAQDWEGLVSKMMSGNVEVVIHYDSNPVYHLPEDYGYAAALGKVSTIVTLAQTENESSAASQWLLPINHDLESWNDFQTRTGLYSLQQPVIYPLYTTRQKEAIVITWASGNESAYHDTLYHEYLMNRWQKEVYPSMKLAVDFKTFWYSALHDGVVSFVEKPEGWDSYKVESFTSLPTPSTSKGYSVVLAESYVLGDGRFASNGWLQELPHPVTKVVWDNYAALSPDTAKELGVDYNDLVEVRIDNRKQKLPVFIQPGMARKVVAIELGYGRTNAGTVGTGIGVNANVFLSKKGSFSQWIYSDAAVSKVNGKYELVTTMEHYSIDNIFNKDIQFTRGIIREGTIDEYEKDPNFIQVEREADKPVSIYKKFEYNGIKWAMSIDLNKCTGCSACVISCNVENNIPVVGKDQVKVSREMQWLRIDRYYSGTPVEPKISLQPMLCQQCDNATCENVCPVAATTHSPDGLNMMVYNRCVGTRYCSNNCPYKVRRFNFFNFRYHFDGGYYAQQPVEMVNNPEVTVRTRGVMEKCTFCVQRIVEARQEALQDGRKFKGSDVVTACQEACPADAIIFGDMNDPNSDVSKMREHPLGYYALEELGTKPNVTYLAKLRNI
ncbi:MAG: TAT-variant-translocated molybdopterin oxidoreductase [Bacteroidetes bacterium]|nr:TAT-variant-translocated molybdopterin oxidoreductase [Bacteroidota bacterium]MCL5737374.1 TAT-variant-translocated molybdopterin oxidoreductase [Bacteroidota bacterium]